MNHFYNDDIRKGITQHFINTLEIILTCEVKKLFSENFPELIRLENLNDKQLHILSFFEKNFSKKKLENLYDWFIEDSWKSKKNCFSMLKKIEMLNQIFLNLNKVTKKNYFYTTDFDLRVKFSEKLSESGLFRKIEENPKNYKILSQNAIDFWNLKYHKN